ncbi:MAG: hypothetical protein ACLS43_03715 [Evtepia gabavorous]
MSQPIIQIQHLNKTFGTGPTAVHALEDINLEIEAGRSSASSACPGRESPR